MSNSSGSSSESEDSNSGSEGSGSSGEESAVSETIWDVIRRECLEDLRASIDPATLVTPQAIKKTVNVLWLEYVDLFLKKSQEWTDKAEAFISDPIIEEIGAKQEKLAENLDEDAAKMAAYEAKRHLLKSKLSKADITEFLDREFLPYPR